MKTSIFIISLFSFFNLQSQNINLSDSLKLISSLELIINNIENPDYETFKLISMDSIYCSICTDAPIYWFKNNKFFYNYFINFKTTWAWKSILNLSNFIIIKEHLQNSADYAIFFTLKTVFGDGAQFGMQFIKSNNVYKLIGFETVP